MQSTTTAAPKLFADANDDDRLIVIPPAEWAQLRDMYRRDWPTHIIGCYTLDTFVRWLEAAPVANLTVYSLNGEWRADGLYVCVHRYQVFANTLGSTTTTPDALARLQRALQLLPDWSHGYKVSTLCARFRPAVQAIMKQHQFTYDFDSLTKLFHLPCKEAAQLDVTPPTGIELRPLSPEHAAHIDAVWPNRHQASDFFIAQIIERSPSVGAFTTDGGKLVAWCLRLQAGPHGALQVDEAYRGRGLGLLVCKALARRLAVELGLDACACVGPDNPASCATFRRAGFAVIDDVYWMRNNATVAVDWMD